VVKPREEQKEKWTDESKWGVGKTKLRKGKWRESEVSSWERKGGKERRREKKKKREKEGGEKAM